MSCGTPNSDAGHLIRWRGRTQGPLSIADIEARLDAGQLGLLTEIQVEGQWMTLRDFHSYQQTKPQVASVEPPDADQGAISAGQAQPTPLPAQVDPHKTPGRKGRLVMALAVIFALCLIGYLSLAGHMFGRANARKEVAASAKHQPATNATGQAGSSQMPTNTAQATNAVTNAGTAPPKAASNAVATTSTPSTNPHAPTVVSSNFWETMASPALPPLPEDEPGTFSSRTAPTTLAQS